jgi:hypothetical protein
LADTAARTEPCPETFTWQLRPASLQRRSLCVLATSSVVAKAEVRRPNNQAEIDHPNRPDSSQQEHCIALSEALYRQAETLSKRTKQVIPREFTRVASNLDEFCGAEDFEKARISIDWMNTCLKNFTKDYKLGFCSRNNSYFCAIDPQSEGCLQSQ